MPIAALQKFRLPTLPGPGKFKFACDFSLLLPILRYYISSISLFLASNIALSESYRKMLILFAHVDPREAIALHRSPRSRSTVNAVEGKMKIKDHPALHCSAM